MHQHGTGQGMMPIILQVSLGRDAKGIKEVTMNMLQQDLFLIKLESQFRDIFQTSKAGRDNSEQRLRAQGFIHAGELLELCTRQQVQQLMERVHLEVFGIHISERQPAEARRRQQALQLGDYDYFDEPVFIRSQRE